MRMNTLTMSREAVSPSPRRTEAKTDRKRSKGPKIRRTGNPPQVTLKQIRCQFVYGIENQPRITRMGAPSNCITARMKTLRAHPRNSRNPRLVFIPQPLEIQPQLQLELPCILEIRRIRNRSAFRRYQAERIGAVDVQNAAAYKWRRAESHAIHTRLRMVEH